MIESQPQIQRQSIADFPGIIDKGREGIDDTAITENILFVHIIRIPAVIIISAAPGIASVILGGSSVKLNSHLEVVVPRKKIFGKIGKTRARLMSGHLVHPGKPDSLGGDSRNHIIMTRGFKIGMAGEPIVIAPPSSIFQVKKGAVAEQPRIHEIPGGRVSYLRADGVLREVGGHGIRNVEIFVIKRADQPMSFAQL